jgi:drug/metabolite transporter (DMT)-like permease
VFSVRNNGAIAGSLIFATMLWGANNAGMKHLVQYWPPTTISSLRFVTCGLLLLALLKITPWFGAALPIPPAVRRQLWTRTGFSLAAYLVAFMVAIKFTSPANVALYFAASPVWALLIEGRSETRGRSRWLPALLAFAGAAIFFWPSLSMEGRRWRGDALGLLASFLWVIYGHQARGLSAQMTGVELTAQSMWRAGVLLIPISLWEVNRFGLTWRQDAFAVFLFSVLGPGLFSFALWSNALKVWPTSKVYLFNNVIPLWTVFWVWLFLGEPITSNIWLALVLIVGAVALAQTNWEKVLGERWLPPE